jgi:hypothetical protein
MLRHVVLLTWLEGTTPEQVAAVTAALDTLPGQIDTIKAYAHGSDLCLTEPRCGYAIVGAFDDAAGWRTDDEHPAHNKARAEVIVPLVAQRASVQFELR